MNSTPSIRRNFKNNYAQKTRKFLIILSLIICGITAKAQIIYQPYISNSQVSYLQEVQLCHYSNGHWGKWYSAPNFVVFGEYDDFYLSCLDVDEGNPQLHLTIKNYRWPDKKTRKLHRKKKLWYQYEGTIEVYGNTPWKANVIIDIQPYKKRPFTYNAKTKDNKWGIGINFTRMH